jgi:hypothetical protein
MVECGTSTRCALRCAYTAQGRDINPTSCQRRRVPPLATSLNAIRFAMMRLGDGFTPAALRTAAVTRPSSAADPAPAQYVS